MWLHLSFRYVDQDNLTYFKVAAALHRGTPEYVCCLTQILSTFRIGQCHLLYEGTARTIMHAWNEGTIGGKVYLSVLKTHGDKTFYHMLLADCIGLFFLANSILSIITIRSNMCFVSKKPSLLF